MAHNIILIDFRGTRYLVDNPKISYKCINCQRLINCLLDHENTMTIECGGIYHIPCRYFVTRNTDFDTNNIYRNYLEYEKEFDYDVEEDSICYDSALSDISELAYKNMQAEEDERKQKIKQKEIEEKEERQRIHEYIQSFRKDYVSPPESKEVLYPFVKNKRMRTLYLSKKVKIENPTYKQRYDDSWDNLSKITQTITFEKRESAHINDVEAWLHGEDV